MEKPLENKDESHLQSLRRRSLDTLDVYEEDLGATLYLQRIYGHRELLGVSEGGFRGILAG